MAQSAKLATVFTALFCLVIGAVDGQTQSPPAPPARAGANTIGAVLTDQDRREIEQLVARYARLLGDCAADEYAALFIPDGVFESNEFRGARHRALYGASGRVQGRAKLVELVQTEDFCLAGRARGNASRASSNVRRPAPTPVIQPSSEGATGRAALGNDGYYDDVYVKTADGWRFKSRSVVMPTRSEASPRLGDADRPR